MGVTRPLPSRNPRRRRVAQAKALAAAAEPSQLARPASAQSRRAVESGRQAWAAWVDACRAYWRFRGLEPAAESAAARPRPTQWLPQARSHATTARNPSCARRRGVLEVLLKALRHCHIVQVITSYSTWLGHMILRLSGMRTPREQRTQARGSGPRGRAGCATSLRRGRFSLEVRQSHRPLEEPIDLLLPLGTERRRRGGRALRSQLRRGRGQGRGGTARPMARPMVRPMARPVARPSSQG